MKKALLQSLRQTKNLLVPDNTAYRRLPMGLARGFYLPINLHHHFRLFFGRYETELLPSIHQFARQGSVIYDIGANDGYYVLALSRMAKGEGQIYAIEADPEIYHQLEQTIQYNAQRGLTGTPMFAPIQLDLAFVGDKSSEASPIAGVPTISVDAMVYEKGYQPPTLIKLDVEGGEVDVLKGCERSVNEHKPSFIIEVHGKDLEAQCIDWLKARGYQVNVIDQQAWLPEHRPISHNRWLSAIKIS